MAEAEWLPSFLLSENSNSKGNGLDKVLSHADVQENNILLTSYGLRLIDFEYSGMCYQAFDIANYFVECTIDYLHTEYPYYSVDQSRGERPAGRAQLLAKKGSSGRMQRPPELVAVRNGPQCGMKAP